MKAMNKSKLLIAGSLAALFGIFVVLPVLPSTDSAYNAFETHVKQALAFGDGGDGGSGGDGGGNDNDGGFGDPVDDGCCGDEGGGFGNGGDNGTTDDNDGGFGDPVDDGCCDEDGGFGDGSDGGSGGFGDGGDGGSGGFGDGGDGGSIGAPGDGDFPGNNVGGEENEPPVDLPAPTCTANLNRSQVTPGSEVRLIYETRNVDRRVTIDVIQGGERERLLDRFVTDDVRNNVAFTPDEEGTYTFRVTVRNTENETDTCRDTLTVKKPQAPQEPQEPQTPTPSCTATIVDRNIILGTDVRLNHKATNANHRMIIQVALDGASSRQTIFDMRSPSRFDGQLTHNPGRVGTHTYVVTVRNDENDIATCRDTVTVTKKDEPKPTPAPQCTANIVDNLIIPGTNVRLNYTTTNAERVIVEKRLEGANSRVVVLDSTDPNKLDGLLTDLPGRLGTHTYFVTAFNEDGDTKACPAEVKVIEPIAGQPTCTLSASPRDLPEGGGNVTLTWKTTNATKVTISGIAGQQLLNSSTVVNVNDDTLFVLVAENNQGVKIECPVSINVDEDNGGGGGGGGGGSNRPRCELDASDRSIKAGETVTLDWETRFGRELTIYEGDEDDGDEIFETDNEDEVDEGEIKVRPRRDTEYTLIVERGSRDRKCTVEIEVEDDDDVVVLQDRFQDPRVAGIALTQVPYTGFEAGPVLTFIFYTLLALWALIVAYVFLKKDKRALAGVANGDSPEENYKKKVQMIRSQMDQNRLQW